jgi:ribosome-associated protein
MADGDLPAVELPGGRVVDERLLVERATTSGGPGGQHANKTSTRVELRVHVASLPLTPSERERVFEKLGRRLNADGTVGVSVATSRHQLRNREEARRRLSALLADALAVDPPRIPTKTPRGVLQRIRRDKQHRAAVRRSRSWRPGGED